MKDRTRSYRTLVPTFLALIKPTFRRPCFTIPALGAAKPSRPTKRRDISQAVIVANKSLSKFNQCFWIVLHSHIYYMLWQVESSAYPRCQIRLNRYLPNVIQSICTPDITSNSCDLRESTFSCNKLIALFRTILIP